MRSRDLSILLAAAGLACAPAFADWKNFLPSPFENGAYLDLFSSYEEDQNPSSPASFGWDDTFIREKVTLFSNGYFYHPRFLQYQASLSGALKQEDYHATFLETGGWRHGTGYEYDIKTFLLPEHPYNLQLYALRYEPLFKQQASTQRNDLQEAWGGLFRYRKKPWFFNARFNDNTNRSDVITSEVRSVGADGQYFRRFDGGNQFSINGAYNPSHFTNSAGLDGRMTEYLFGNVVDLQRARLNFSLTGNDSDQQSPTSGDFASNQISWYEVLTLFLPLNFRSDVSYRIQNNESHFTDPGISADRKLTDLNKTFQIDVIQKLFQSLDSRYTYQDNTRESSGGDTDFFSHTLSLAYTKWIPDGRVLAGVTLGRSQTENRGPTDIVSEPHPATGVPGTLSLRQANIDPRTIAVFLRSPLPPFEVIQLVEGVHYTVSPVGNSFEIDIVTLPPQFALPGTFDISVSYSLIPADFTLRADDTGYNVAVELLDAMLTPYAGYATVRSDVLAGVFPGIPLDSTTTTLGLRFRRGPLRAMGEYQNLEWQVSPYTSRRAEVQYVSSLDPTTRLYAIVSYLHKYFSQGTSSVSPEPYTDETTTASGNFQKQVPAWGLVFSAGGAYSHLRGRVTGNAYSLNSALTWKMGKMDLSAGATVYSSDTEGTTGTLTSRFHQYYYVNLRRTF